MAHWTYRPQVVLNDTLDTAAWIVPTGPRIAYSGRATTTEQFVRTFRLQYTAVNTSNLNGMIDFYNARKGQFESFTWLNPSDARTYTVRFGDAIGTTVAPFIGNVSAQVVFIVTSG